MAVVTDTVTYDSSVKTRTNATETLALEGSVSTFLVPIVVSALLEVNMINDARSAKVCVSGRVMGGVVICALIYVYLANGLHIMFLVPAGYVQRVVTP